MPVLAGALERTATAQTLNPGARVQISPELVEACREYFKAASEQLPQTASDERIARNRMPSTAVGASLRRGAPMEEVAAQAALRLAERWSRKLISEVARDDIPLAVSQLVHDTEESPMPSGQLLTAMQRVVPMPDVVNTEGWEFMENTLQIFDVEGRFDRQSCIHKAPARQSLQFLCGSPVPVWERNQWMSDFPRAHRAQADRSARHTNPSAHNHQDLSFLKRSRSYFVPGPTNYGDLSPKLLSPRRGDFRASGRARTVSTFSILSQRPRGDLF